MDRSSLSLSSIGLLLALAPIADAQLIPVTPGFNASAFLITPDNSRVVFMHPEDTSGILYSARTNGVGTPIPISPLTGGGASLFQAQISPDSAWVLYNRDEHPTDRLHVATYASRIDGSTPAVLLNISPIYDDDTSQYNLAISPDSRYAIIRADQGDNSFDLLSRRIDGSSPPLPLNDPLHPDEGSGNAVPSNWSVAGNLVIFQDPNNEQGRGLYSRPFDGSAPAQKLSPGGETFSFHAVSDSKVAMITYPGPPQSWNLYSNSTAGGALTLMHSKSNDFYGLRGLSISPDGGHALIQDGEFQLYTVPTDGLATPKLLGPFSDSTSIGYSISPDSTRVAFFTRQGHHGAVELDISPIDASAAPKRLNPPAPGGREVRFGNYVYFTADSRYLVFTSDQLVADRQDIFSVPVDGSSLPTRLSGPAVFTLTPDSKWLIAALNTDPDDFIDRFVAIPITGGEPILLAESPYLTGGIPNWGEHWRISQDGSLLVFVADNNAGVREIFAVAIPEPGTLSVLVATGLGMVSLRRRRGRVNLQ
jgi:hypothetical protein